MLGNLHLYNNFWKRPYQAIHLNHLGVVQCAMLNPNFFSLTRRLGP